MALLPLCILYLISDFIYVIAYYVVKYRRKAVIDNLKRSFPQKSAEEINAIERGFYRHLCDCIVETVKLLHISDKEIDRRFKVTNGSLIEEIAADGKPIILYLGHYSNWEWTSAITRHYAAPAMSGLIYRPLRDGAMDRIIRKVRSRFNPFAVPQKQAFRTLLKMKQEGKQYLVAFLADQRPNSLNLNHWTEFLNQDTAYSVGGDEIGSRIDANFVYMEMEKVKRGHYSVNFSRIEPNDNEEYPYVREFMRKLEQTINKAPEYWLWSHKRWRFTREDNKPANK